MPIHVLLAYKNFAANKGISHIGLGVSAINTTKVLRREGIRADTAPTVKSSDIRDKLLATPTATHFVMSAPWIPAAEWSQIASEFPEVQFAVNCHSNVGFLQADTNAVRLLREYMSLERSSHNFSIAGNSEKFCRWIQTVFDINCKYLPNLYFLDRLSGRARPPYNGGTIRVGMFGATRPLKNMMTGAGAALELAKVFREPIELWISGGRTDGGEVVLRSIQQLYADLTFAKLVEAPWKQWPEFRRIVSNMHVLLQPSYTESFNMVTADGIAEGVPSAVSDAIDWAPESWKVPVDDPIEMAKTARHLLLDGNAARDGYTALERHNLHGILSWRRWFEGLDQWPA